MTRSSLPALAGALALIAGAAAHAQAQAPAAPPAPPPYGPNITLEQAMKVVDAANAEAARRKKPATIAIVDTSGSLVYYQRATGAPGTAEAFATKKAIAAAMERRPTSADQARLKADPNPTPFLPHFFPFAGGQPLIVDGKIVGAIGETGGDDDDVAKAGAAALR